MVNFWVKSPPYFALQVKLPFKIFNITCHCWIAAGWHHVRTTLQVLQLSEWERQWTLQPGCPGSQGSKCPARWQAPQPPEASPSFCSSCASNLLRPPLSPSTPTTSRQGSADATSFLTAPVSFLGSAGAGSVRKQQCTADESCRPHRRRSVCGGREEDFPWHAHRRVSDPSALGMLRCSALEMLFRQFWGHDHARFSIAVCSRLHAFVDNLMVKAHGTCLLCLIQVVCICS